MSGPIQRHVSAGRARVKWHNDYSQGSIRDAFLRCRTAEEIEGVSRELLEQRRMGKVKASPGTLRKLGKAAMARLGAIRSARLYGPDGRPVLQ